MGALSGISRRGRQRTKRALLKGTQRSADIGPSAGCPKLSHVVATIVGTTCSRSRREFAGPATPVPRHDVQFGSQQPLKWMPRQGSGQGGSLYRYPQGSKSVGFGPIAASRIWHWHKASAERLDQGWGCEARWAKTPPTRALKPTTSIRASHEDEFWPWASRSHLQTDRPEISAQTACPVTGEPSLSRL